MFPVFSLLRRAAAHHIYVTDPMTSVVNGAVQVKLERPTETLDFATLRWQKASDVAVMAELMVTADSPQATAISLSVAENRMAAQLPAMEFVYTLLLGPEEEHTDGSVVTRRVRLGLVRGVFRSRPGALLAPQVTKASGQPSSRRAPRGTVRL